MRQYKAIFILPGPVPPPDDVELDRIYQLSPSIKSVVLQPIWPLNQKNKENFSFHITRGEVNYFLIQSGFFSLWMKFIFDFCFYLVWGIKAHLQLGKCDVVICYGVTRTGFSAWILSLLIRRPLLVEVPGRPTDAFLVDRNKPRFIDKVKNKITVLWSQFLFSRAKGIRLFYSQQIKEFKVPRHLKIKSFPDFVPVQLFESNQTDNNYILFVGHPWPLKGVDSIILAYKSIEYKIGKMPLKIVGHCENMSFYEGLVGDSRNIELCDAIPYPDAIELIKGCSFVVLASKTEGMPRVIVEAMAAGKPFVASSVGGIPEYIVHGEEGFIFDQNDHNSLSKYMSILALDKDKRVAMGAKGKEKVLNQWSNELHSKNFLSLVNEVVDD